MRSAQCSARSARLTAALPSRNPSDIRGICGSFPDSCLASPSTLFVKRKQRSGAEFRTSSAETNETSLAHFVPRCRGCRVGRRRQGCCAYHGAAVTGEKPPDMRREGAAFMACVINCRLRPLQGAAEACRLLRRSASLLPALGLSRVAVGWVEGSPGTPPCEQRLVLQLLAPRR